MSLTIKNLRDLLTELIEEGTPEDSEVRIATQPSWPLQFDITGVALRTEAEELEAESTGEPYEPDHDQPEVVYLTDGSHPYDDSPYAPRAAWEVARR